MRGHIRRGHIRILVCAVLVLGLLAACAVPTQSAQTPSGQPSASISWVPASQVSAPATPAPTAASAEPPKYIFLFIGDGMSFAQVNAAEMVLGSLAGEIVPRPLCFTQFPVLGSAITRDATSFIPDSAATGTAISCGVKTKTGTIGLDADLASVPNITELFKANGKRIGIVTSVTLNNATPAAFYAHADSRGDYYDIAVQMATSGIDYFGGGSLTSPTGSSGDEVSVFTLLEQNGYSIADTAEEIAALNGASGKTYAISPVRDSSGAMPFAIDAEEDAVTLADLVRTGIDVLDNDDGFFMMCESGKVDWACHANDAASAVGEVQVLSDSVQVALDFAAKHPDETLIIVTADHETGGMALGNATTGYGTHFELLAAQTMSYSAFTAAFNSMKREGLTLVDMLPVIREAFGIGAPGDSDAAVTLTTEEYARLKAAFVQSMLPKSQRDSSAEAALRYGSYEPLTVTLTHLLDTRAGIGWTTYAHTAMPVPVYAFGAYAERFNGTYDNTAIFARLVEVCGL